MGDDNEHTHEDDPAGGTGPSDDGEESREPVSAGGFVVDEEGDVEVLGPEQTYGQMYGLGGGGGEDERRFELRAPSIWTGWTRIFVFVGVAAYLGLILPDAFGGPVGVGTFLMLAGLPLALLALLLYRFWRLPDQRQAIVFDDDAVRLPKGPDTAGETEVPYEELRSLTIMVRGGNQIAMIETDRRRFSYGADDFRVERGPELFKREAMDRIRSHPDAASILERMQTLEEHARTATSRGTPVTYGILGILIVYYVIEHATGALDEPFGLVALGANSAALIEQGQYFRLLSGNFLHGGFVHIFMNGIALFFLGLAIERLLGSWRFLCIYLISALGGALGSYLWTAAPLSVGSSTAIFGLVGAFGVLHLKYWSELPPPYRQTVRWWVVILTVNLGLSAIPMVDGAAHVAGLLTGAAVTFGILLPMPSFEPSRPPERWMQVLTGAFVLLFAFGLGRAGLYAMGEQPSDRTVLLEQIVDRASERGAHSELNRFAWMTATSPDATREQLDVAKGAIDEALELVEAEPPEHRPGMWTGLQHALGLISTDDKRREDLTEAMRMQYRDTLATLHYRLGLKSSGKERRRYLTDAVRLEHDVLEEGETLAADSIAGTVFASQKRTFHAQIARFLKAHLNEYGLYHTADRWTGSVSFDLQFGDTPRLKATLETSSEGDVELTGLVFDEEELIGLVEICMPSGERGGEVELQRTPPSPSPSYYQSCRPGGPADTQTIEPHVRPAMTETDANCDGRIQGRFWSTSKQLEGQP